MSKLPHMKRPCKDCPFRKNSLKGWLGEARASEFARCSNFLCHKDTDFQCAGHMIMRGQNNDFVRMASRLNANLDLKGESLIFERSQDFINHHS